MALPGPTLRVAAGSRPDPLAAVVTGLAAVGAIAFGLVVGLANLPWFEWLNGILRLQDPVGRGLLFSSWLLVIGGPLVLWRPASFALRPVERKDWPLVTVVTGAFMALTAGALVLVGPTPYSDASLLIEVVVVPFTEELVFRGVLLTALVAVLVRVWQQSTAITLAVAVNAAAFGIAHAANITTQPAGFVASQVAFATILGAGCAYLVWRTRSLLPAIVLHGAVNAVVVAL